MKPNKTYLKGKSVFIVSLIVIVVTILTVYASGIHFQRSITSNFYISLGIIAVTLFSFLTYGLYKGVSLEDDFPKLKRSAMRAVHASFAAAQHFWQKITHTKSRELQNLNYLLP